MQIDVYKSPDFYAAQHGQEFILLVIKNGMAFVISKDEGGIKATCHGMAKNNWMAKDIASGEDKVNYNLLGDDIKQVIDMLPDSEDEIPGPKGPAILN